LECTPNLTKLELKSFKIVRHMYYLLSLKLFQAICEMKLRTFVPCGGMYLGPNKSQTSRLR